MSKQILRYVLSPILIIFLGSFILDIPFRREQELNERIIRAIIIGILLGIVLFTSDKRKSKKQGK